MPDRNAPMARLTASAYLMVQIVRIYYGIVKNNLCILEQAVHTFYTLSSKTGFQAFIKLYLKTLSSYLTRKLTYAFL